MRFLLLIAMLLAYGCVNEEDARRALEAEGFMTIEFTGYDVFACSDDDFYHTGFVVQKDGKERQGTVCSGLFFKGSTIRWK